MNKKLYNVDIIITTGKKVITIGALFYPTTRNTLHSDGFAWRQSVQRSPLLQSTMTRDLRFVVQWITVNIGGFIHHEQIRC